MNHLASCAPPFCSCHPPQHICQWEKKKNPQHTQIENHIQTNCYMTQKITSSNWNSFAVETGGSSPRTHKKNPTYRWQMAEAVHTAAAHGSSKTIRFLHVGPMVLPARLPVLSLGRHMPLLGRILMRTKSSLFNQQRPPRLSQLPQFPLLLHFPRISYYTCWTPQKGVKAHFETWNGHRRGIIHRRRNIAPKTPPPKKTNATSFVDMSHMVTNH